MPTKSRGPRHHFELNRTLPVVDEKRRLNHTVGTTTTEKIAISLPKDLASRARQAVRRGDAPSVSAYVSRALERHAKLDDLNALLDEMLAETGGPLTNAEVRAADRDLGVRQSRQGVPPNERAHP